MKNLNFKKQHGFSILAVILVIVAVIVAIGVWALSGQANTSNSSNSSADIQAASIVNDAGSIKLAFDKLIINGTNPDNISFFPNTAGTNNMLDPTNGIQVPKDNSNALKASPNMFEGFWVYNANNFIGNNVGTSLYDQTIFLTGIKDSVCRRINYSLYGSTVIPSLTTGGITFSGDINLNNPNSTITVNLSGYPLVNGWTSGCMGMTNNAVDQNFYFRILRIN